MGKIRRQHSSRTKLEAAIAMISGKGTVSELSQKYGVHPGVLQRWKTELLEGEPIFLAAVRSEQKKAQPLTTFNERSANSRWTWIF